MQFIHLTDTHLVRHGHALYGLDPRARLKHAINSIIAEHDDAAMCIVTGDLTHAGHPEAYEQLAVELARLPMPVYPILGNHDNRQYFLNHFPEVETDQYGFVQYEKEVGQYRGLFLDTNEPDVSYGVFGEQRAQWLQKKLAQDDRPVLIFMHHPAFALGIPSMDKIALCDTSFFEQAIHGHTHRIRHIFFGHIHRPVFGHWQGMPFSTIRGTNHQLPLDMRGEKIIPGSHEPPQYGVVLVNEQSLVVHVHDFLDKSERFILGEH